MTRTRSLRVRLTATFVVVGAVLVAGGFAGAAWLLRRAVWSPLDAALQEEAELLVLVDGSNSRAATGLTAVPEDQDDLASAVSRLGAERDLGPDKFIVVTSVNGTVISSGRVPPGAAAARAAAANATPFFVADGPHVYRVFAPPASSAGEIAIGVRVDRQVRALRRALVALAAGAVALLIAIGLLAWSITTSATREIVALTSELEGVEADSITRRVSPRATTEVARLAEALNRLLARLELSVTRLQRFTADAAHELRTPLAALRAHLDVALARPPSVDAYRDGLLDASEQTERLAMLAEGLLTLSAIESGGQRYFTAVDVGALAHEVAEFLEAVAQEQHRDFTVAVDPRARVQGDPLLLKRLLLNLLGNAFTHTAEGIAVRLAVEQCNGEVVLTVGDRGGGIADVDRRLLFERFASSRNGTSGAGLGLAICREIVAGHGGSIAVDSGVDRGTTVTVHLPSA